MCLAFSKDSASRNHGFLIMHFKVNNNLALLMAAVLAQQVLLIFYRVRVEVELSLIPSRAGFLLMLTVHFQSIPPALVLWA